MSGRGRPSVSGRGRVPKVSGGRRRNESRMRVESFRVVSRGRVMRNIDVSRGGRAKIALSRARREVSPIGRGGRVGFTWPGMMTCVRVESTTTWPGEFVVTGYGDVGYVPGG